MEKNIIQLRNYHINKGKDNDKTPLYPITVVEAIEGLSEALSNLSGVTKIHGAPDEDGTITDTEAGKLYYDVDNGVLYIGTGEGMSYDLLFTQAEFYSRLIEYKNEILTWETIASPNGHQIGNSIVQGAYDLYPYELSLQSLAPFNNTLDIYCQYGGIGMEYCFYYTQSGSTVPTINIVQPDAGAPTVSIPDAVQEVIDGMEDGHTYEFNIFNNVLLVTDITATQS